VAELDADGFRAFLFDNLFYKICALPGYMGGPHQGNFFVLVKEVVYIRVVC
jgi:hypothetical protein